MDGPPNVFGSYSVRSVIGAGPGGPVYRGYDRAADRAVVIRTFESQDLKYAASAQAELVAALRRLCEGALDVPGIARPLDCGVEDGTPFLVFELLPGRTMDSLLQQEGPRPPTEVLQRVSDMAAALDRAAVSNVHHGALGADSVVCDLETTGITGYGVVQALMKVGIPVDVCTRHASPQRVAGAPPTRADDIYSLAALTLELLIGVADVAAAEKSRRRGPRPAAHETRAFTRIAGVDAGRLRAAFASALADETSRRPSTAQEFLDALRDALAAKRPIELQDHPLSVAAAIREEIIAAPPADLPLSSNPIIAAPVAAHVRARSTFHVVAACLALGFAIGFGSGFVFGQQRGATVPAQPIARQTPSAAPAPVSTSPPVRESSTLQQPLPTVEERSAAQEPPPPAVLPPAEPEPAPPPPQPLEQVVARVTVPTARREPSPPVVDTSLPPWGALQVISRPTGARVFVDEMLVGTTPLLVSNLATGLHHVRLEADGEESWTGVVRIASGKRFRVSASLGR